MPTAPRTFNPSPKRSPKPEQRKTSCQRGYGYRWQQVRKAWLALHPACVQCGRIAVGKDGKSNTNHVDHIKDHNGDYELMWDPANRQTLCPSCHARKGKA